VKALVISLSMIFVLAFALMAAGGGYLIYTEINPQRTSSYVEVKVERDSFTLNLVRATLGLIMFWFGAVGLILMMYKVPTKEFWVIGQRAAAAREWDS